MTTELHRVTADDWALLREVRLRALADSPDAFGSTLALARDLDEAEWRRRAGNGGLTLVARDDGTALGMAGAMVGPDDATAYVWGMWTAPAARGRGVGAALLDALVAWCESRADAVVLHVTEGNDAARRLYLARGFVPTGTWEPLREGSALRIEELRLALGVQRVRS